MAELYPLSWERGGQLEEVHAKILFDYTYPIQGVTFTTSVSPIIQGLRDQTNLSISAFYNDSYEFETEQYGYIQLEIDGKKGTIHNRIYPSGSGIKRFYIIKNGIEPRNDGTFADSVILHYTCIPHNKIAERYDLTNRIKPHFYNDPVAIINSITYDRTLKQLSYNLTYGHDKYYVENEVGFRAAAGNLSYIRTIFANGDTWSQPLRTDRAGDILTNDKIITDENRHIKAGETINYEYVIYSTNGRKKTLKGKYTIPANVTDVRIGDLNLKAGGKAVKLPYTLINKEGATNFAEKGVTFESSNSYVATIDSTGTVRPLHSGVVTFTVTSHDNAEDGVNYPFAEKTFFVESGTNKLPFVDDVEPVEYLTAPLMSDFVTACMYIHNNRRVPGSTDSYLEYFKEYETEIEPLYQIMRTINTNVKIVADMYEEPYDKEALKDFDARENLTNKSCELYDRVNEWIRILHIFMKLWNNLGN